VRRDLRLLPVAIAAWVAAWWGTAAQAATVRAAAGVALAASAVLAALAVTASRRHGCRVLAAAALSAVVAAAAAAVLAGTAGALARRQAQPWAGWVAAAAVAHIEGRLAVDPQRIVPSVRGGGDRYAVRVDVDTLTARGLRSPADLPVLVLAPPAWSGLTAGQGVSFAGRLAPSEPGDEAAALVAALGPVTVTPASWPWRASDAVRAALRRACDGLPDDAGGLLPSLVDGDTSRLPAPLQADLRAAGLTHLTAVSGANLTVVAEAVLWSASALRAPRRVRVPLMVLTLAAFVVLARPSPSVLRAAAMGAVGIVAATGGRPARGVPALGAAAVVLLAVDPWLARSAGFALSAVATAALLLLAPVWARALGRRLPSALAVALAAPAAAQVACGPVTVLLQPAVSLVAVPANLLAEPVVAPATVAGVAAAVTGLVWPWAAHLVAALGALGTAWVAVVAHRGAALPLASVPWPPGLPGAVLLAAVEAVLVALTLPGPRRVLTSPATPSRVTGRRAVIAAAAGAVGLGLLAASRAAGLGLPGVSPGLPGDWTVVMCDVGQGDATVLRTGPDRAVLVDTGPDPALVDGCLGRLGVHHLDLVLLTHFHADHVGGLEGALHGRDARRLLVSPFAAPADNAAAVRRAVTAERLPLAVAHVGDAGEAGTGVWRVRWRVLTASAAGAGVTGPADGGDGTVVNESSVAITAEVSGPGGALRAVLLGDLETQGQHALAERLRTGADTADGPVDVVKVAHHGSAKQDPLLYRLLAPRVGLVGVGAGNDYGHPAPGTLAMLASLGVRVLRTDTSGDLAVAASRDGALRLAVTR
jgi:competence protein ComEC